MSKKLVEQSVKQSLYQVKISTGTLIIIANRANVKNDQVVAADPNNTAAVVAAQNHLLENIRNALANEASIADVMASIEEKKSKYEISPDADMALGHVLSLTE